MAAESYRVLFEGKINPGQDPAEVKVRLALLFGKSADQVDALLSGKTTLLKTVTEAEQGRELVSAILEAGAQARLEMPEGGGSVEQPVTEPAGMRDRIDITLAAIAVTLVWALHLVLVVTLAAGLLYHLIFNLDWYSEYGVSALFLHTLPALIGLALVAALIKPLFPLRPRPSSELALDPQRHKRFIDMVGELCALTGAPAPRHVVVTAGTELELDFGLIPEIPAGAPTLRLGLTLVNGLTAAQLAGLLGREFAFTARGQMPMRTQLVRASHRRLREAGFGQDALDHHLERLQEGSAAQALSARALAAVLGFSRQLHRALLRVVHGVSAGALRRLDHRADKWQAAVAGSQAFRGTLAKRRLLEIAAEAAAAEEERRWWEEGKLAERLPTAALNLARSRTDDLTQEVSLLMQQPSDGAHGFSPSDMQRIERVEQSPQPARYRNDTPARNLLSGFERLSRRVSYLYYRNTLRLPATADRLTPATAETGKTELLLRHYLLDLHRAPVALSPTIGEADANALKAQIRGLSQRLKSTQASAGAALQKYRENDQQLIEANLREVLAGAKLPMTGEPTDLEAIQKQCRRLENEEAKILNKLQESARIPAERLGIGLARLATEAAGPEIERLRSALRRTDEVIPNLRLVRDHTIILELLLSYLPSRNGALTDRIDEQTTDLRQRLLAIRLSLREAPWPFAKPGTRDNLARHVISRSFESADPNELLDIAAAALSRTQAIRQQILVRLVQLAMSGERRLLAA